MDIVSLIIWFTIVVCLIGLVFALYHYRFVAETKPCKELSSTEITSGGVSEEDFRKLVQAGDLISSSAMTYLIEEYTILGTFVLGFGVIVYVPLPYILVIC